MAKPSGHLKNLIVVPKVCELLQCLKSLTDLDNYALSSYPPKGHFKPLTIHFMYSFNICACLI